MRNIGIHRIPARSSRLLLSTLWACGLPTFASVFPTSYGFPSFLIISPGCSYVSPMLFLCCGYFIPKIPLSDLFCIPIFLFPRLFRFPCKPGIPICFLVSYCSPKLWFWRFSRIRTSESDIRLKAWLWDFASGAYRHLWDPDVALCVKSLGITPTPRCQQIA